MSPQVSKVVAMFAAGASRAEIADDMMISDTHLAQIIHKARQLGVVIPFGGTGGRPSAGKGCYAHLPTAARVEELLQQGVSYAILAERYSTSANSLKVRVCRYRKTLAK